MSDAILDELDSVDAALYRHVQDNIPITDPDTLNELLARYPADSDQSLERGFNFSGEGSYRGFISNIKDGVMLGDSKASSWTPDSSTAKGFAVSKKTYNDVSLMRQSSDRMVGETVVGYGGLVVSATAPAERLIDISKTHFMAEHEFLLMPNTELSVSFVEHKPMWRLLDEAKEGGFSVDEIMKSSEASKDLKSYLVSNYPMDISSDAMESTIGKARARYDDRLIDKFDGGFGSALYSDDDSVTHRDGYRFITQADDFGRDRIRIRTDDDLFFSVTKERGRRGREDSVTLWATLPSTWIGYFESELLSVDQFDELKGVVDSTIDIAARLAEDFGVTEMDGWSERNYRAICDAVDLKQLHKPIKERAVMNMKEYNMEVGTQSSGREVNEFTDRLIEAMGRFTRSIGNTHEVEKDAIDTNLGEKRIVPKMKH
ncbi:hypothetical protein VCHA53O466_140042 [Vibrio chagasii]|nr:hypothetical protein VCHA53O466_140042 [Vibrio chagasii]